MLIKIFGRNEERFNETVTRVMNLACVAFKRGIIPTQIDMQEPERTGLYWYLNKEENKFELLPTANSHKAFIRSKGENFIVIEFFSKYDKGGKQVNALSNLILAFFDNDEVEAV